MKAVRSTNTSAEMKVRRLVFSLGYRYRIHAKKLPGCPDLLFPSRRKVIFVHGCFWHGHDCPKGMKRPATNIPYWSNKLSRNKERDKKNQTLLAESGWKTLVIWECDLNATGKVRRRILRFLGKAG
jgi:DNA mismatch endonuclease (patch repair protein)